MTHGLDWQQFCAGDRLRELVAQYTEVPQKLAADGRPSGGGSVEKMGFTELLIIGVPSGKLTVCY